MGFIAGPYTVTYGGQDIGITADGIELEYMEFADPIIGDNLGQSKQDGVWRGHDVFFNFVMQEYNAAAAKAAFWPGDATFGKHGQVGRLQTALATALVLTAVAGTPAAAISAEAIITAGSCILTENFGVRQLFAARHRSIPLRFQALPYLDGADTIHFKMAAAGP